MILNTFIALEAQENSVKAGHLFVTQEHLFVSSLLRHSSEKILLA